MASRCERVVAPDPFFANLSQAPVAVSSCPMSQAANDGASVNATMGRPAFVSLATGSSASIPSTTAWSTHEEQDDADQDARCEEVACAQETVG